jgi:hypothetical protein
MNHYACCIGVIRVLDELYEGGRIAPYKKLTELAKQMRVYCKPFHINRLPRNWFAEHSQCIELQSHQH